MKFIKKYDTFNESGPMNIEEIDFNELYNKWYDMQVNHHKQIHINNPKMQAIAIGALKDKEDFIETCKKDTKFLTFVYSLFY